MSHSRSSCRCAIGSTRKFIRGRSNIHREYGVIADLASADGRVEASSFVRSAPLARLVGGEDGGPVGG